MKTLYVLRHTKAADRPDLDDVDRPLAPRGERDGARIAEHLATKRIAPEMVRCSPAVRTRALLDLILPSLVDPRIVFDDVLYGADAAELRALVRQISDDVGSAMIIGHNPGLADLVFAYGDEWVELPTGALVTLELDDWSADAGSVRAVVVPKQLD